MHLNNIIPATKIAVVVLFASAMLLVSACTPPEEQAEQYYQQGMKYFNDGDYVKANIQFRNALQIDNSMTKAIWGQVLANEKQSNYQQVFRLLNAVLKNDPNHQGAIIKLGRFFLIAGKLDKALDFSERAIKLDDTNSEALVLRAAVLVKLDNGKKAIELINKVLDNNPYHIEALIVYATQMINEEKYEQALKYIDKGLEKDAKSISLNLLKIQSFSKLGKTENTEQIYKNLISYYPDAITFSYALAKHYISANQIDKAEDIHKRLIQAEPKNINAKLRFIKFLNATKGRSSGKKQLEEFSKNEPDNYEIKFALSGMYIDRKEYDNAKTILQNIISSDEASSEAKLKARGILAGVFLAKGNQDSAQSLINQVLSIDKRNEQALILKAQIHIDNNKFDDAVAELRTILRDNPRSSRALFLLGNAHNSLGSPELADESYLKGFRASNYSARYGIPYVKFLLRNNDYKKAENILEDILKLSPGNIPALKLLAQTQLFLGDWAGAQKIADILTGMSGQQEFSTQITNEILAEKKEYSKSIELLKQVYRQSPDNIRPVITLVRTYLLAGKTKEAGEFVDSVIRANPNSVEARLLRAQIYLSVDDDDKARTIYENVIKKFPEKSIAYYHMALLEARNNRLESALNTIKVGLSISEKNVPLRLIKADVLIKKQDGEGAISIYKELIKERKSTDVIINNYASLLLENSNDLKSYEEAFNLSQRFKRSEIPQFLDTHGWAAYKVGKYMEAERFLKMAVEKLPSNAVFHYHLGMNYIARKNNKLAHVELEKAQNLTHGLTPKLSDEIKKILEKMN